MFGGVRSLSMWVLLAFAAPRARAMLMLQLSSPDDLTALHVGDSMRIDVNLDGLDTGTSQSLVTLTAAVRYPSSLLGAVTASSAGAVIPDPLNEPLDFQLLTGVGQVDGVFITFSDDPAHQIGQNGPVWTFALTARAPGSGEFLFDPLSLVGEQFDSANPASPILQNLQAGAPLPFAVSRSAGGEVPEPVTVVMSFMGLIALGQTVLGRKRCGCS